MKGVVEVRNCLVHSGGWLPDFQGRSAVEAFTRRHELVLSDADYLRADLRLAQVVLDCTKAFIEQLYRVALERYPKP